MFRFERRGRRFLRGFTRSLYAGLLLVAVSGIVLAPVFHRVLHAMHAYGDG